MPRLFRRLLPHPRRDGWHLDGVAGVDGVDGLGLDAVDVLDLDIALPAEDDDPYGLDAWWESA